MTRLSLVVLLTLGAVAGMGAQEAPPGADSPVVRAVLFYSPSCPHCRQVMTLDLPVLLERYGDAVQIAAVNTATPGGEALYLGTMRYLDLPRERLGVPMLVVGSRVLVGALEIPRDLPGIIREGLSANGVDWPDVPVIQQAVAMEMRAARERAEAQAPEPVEPSPEPAAEDARAEPAGLADSATTPGTDPTAHSAVERAAPERARPAPPVEDPGAAVVERTDPTAPPLEAPGATEPTETPGRTTATPAPTDRPSPGASSRATDAPVAVMEAEAALPVLTMGQRFMLDPNGGTLAVVVLGLLLAILALTVAGVFQRARLPVLPPWAAPALALAGIGVASYLAYVEITGAVAVCGPVGDCNTVQQSEYARFFGVLPVAVLGWAGYAAMAVGWYVGYPGRRVRPAAVIMVWALALVATLVSIYLTFLEPFVIGATCAWCLASSVITGLILVAVTPWAALMLRRSGPASAEAPHASSSISGRASSS